MLSSSKFLGYRVYRTPGCPSFRVDVQVKPQRGPWVVSAASADRGSSGASFGLLNSLLWTWKHGSTLAAQPAKQKWLQGLSSDGCPGSCWHSQCCQQCCSLCNPCHVCSNVRLAQG